MVIAKYETKVELDLCGYATKSHSKNAQVFETSQFAERIYLGSLQSDVDKLYIDDLKKVPSGLNIFKSQVAKLNVDKLKSVPVDLKKSNDVVEKEVVKKLNILHWLKTLMSLLLVNLLKTNHNTKIKDIENKIPIIKILATTDAITAAKNNIPNASNLVKKYQTLKLRISSHQIIINWWILYLI